MLFWKASTQLGAFQNIYHYVRDAQGNVLAVYDDNNGTNTLRQSEVYLYGSSRLGVFKPAGSRSLAANGTYTRRLGRKEYELTDHLGNVRAVIGDYRQAEGGGIRAALRSYSDHYAFGLEMPGMGWRGGHRYNGLCSFFGASCDFYSRCRWVAGQRQASFGF